MISSINYANYYKIASMTQSLNGFIMEAISTKAQISSSGLTSSLNFPKEIGSKVDIYA